MDKNGFVRAYEGWHTDKKFYGSASAVEATFKIKPNATYIGVGINIGFEGNYQLRFKTDNTVILIKRSNYNYILKSVQVGPPDGEISLKLSCKDGLLLGYMNGEKVIEFDDSKAFTFFEGYTGVWIHPENSAEFYGFGSQGAQKTPPQTQTVQKSQKRYRFCDFPYGWHSKPYASKFVLKDGRFSTVSAEYTESLLHLFDKDCFLRLSFSFSKAKENASFGFLVRKSPDTAYLKCGYGAEKGVWRLEDTPALFDCKVSYFESLQELSPDTGHTAEITANGDKFSLFVDGKAVFENETVVHTGFGKVGLFSENCILSVSDFELVTENSTPAADGVLQYVIEKPNTPAASMQVIEAPNGELVGVRKILPQNQLNGTGSSEPIDPNNPESRGIFLSKDNGASFCDLPYGGEYPMLCTNGAYQSIIRLKSGKYLQVLLANNLEVLVSDDLKSWQSIGYVLKAESTEGMIFHTQSLSEYTLPDGTNRIFLPLAEKTYVNNGALGNKVCGRNTAVYFSDDGGATWERSKTDTDTVLNSLNQRLPINDITECKVVLCSDNTLRLYCTRNASRFLCYFESKDFGVTWHGFESIKYMQCAKSSFCVCHDKYNKGTYYLVWVNSLPLSRGNTSERTRLSLARSTDGKNWEFLCDAERMSLRYPDNLTGLRSPLFQLVDPAVYVGKEYIILTCGTVLFSAGKGLKAGSAFAVHHQQRTLVTRLEKNKLKPHAWDYTNICDTSFLGEKGGGWL